MSYTTNESDNFKEDLMPEQDQTPDDLLELESELTIFGKNMEKLNSDFERMALSEEKLYQKLKLRRFGKARYRLALVVRIASAFVVLPVITLFYFSALPRRVPLDLLLINALPFGLGVYLSVATQDWMWLARSGSVITALAILVFAFDLRRRLEEFKRTILAERESFTLHHIAALAPITDKEKANWFIRGGELYINFWILKSAECMERIEAYAKSSDLEMELATFRKFEIAMLVFGTLLWGFGDLVGPLIGMLGTAIPLPA